MNEPEREPDWDAARAVVDEMIAEVGGLPEHARAWARSVLGADGSTTVVRDQELPPASS